MKNIPLRDLQKQEAELKSLARDGVKAALRRLKSVQRQIQLKAEQLGITDSSLVFTKPGYHSRMIQTLSVQASKGSEVSVLELQKLANWLIEMNAQQKSRVGKVPYSNTGTLCHGWQSRGKKA